MGLRLLIMGISTNIKDEAIASSSLDITESQYQVEMVECVKQLNEAEIYIQALIGRIRVLEAENDYLVKTKTEFERKLSRLDANPFYKASIKLYHILNRLHWTR